MSLLVLCPSRGRPWGALEAYQSFVATKELDDSRFLAIVDSDDDKLASYRHLDIPLSVISPQGNMVADLNYVALFAAENNDIVGFIGDDHRFRTPGWDAAFSRTLTEAGGGFAYGNDLFWPHGELPTQIFMSSEVIRVLGYMAIPTCKHLYVDNGWKVVGEAIDRLFYFPRFIIEHRHPAAGKADWDERYLLVNSEERYADDRQAFETWLASKAPEDILRVKFALSGPPLAGRDQDEGWPNLPE